MNRIALAHLFVTQELIASKLSFSFLALLLCLIFFTNGSAQNGATTATLAGVVRDAAGASVSGATVTLRNLATNQTRQTESAADGTYRLSALPVGVYEVRAEAEGFARYTNPQVTVELGRAQVLDITLQPASLSAEVTVNDRPPALDVSQTASTTSIDPERIAELPVNSRNYLQFTLLAPGVLPSNAQTTGGQTGSPGQTLSDSGFTFGGLRPRSNLISIDGLDNTDETTGAARVALSPEIVREFQVINNGLSAEFGGAAGGAINVVTKTGANDFHGTVFTFLQNEIFNARNFLDDSRGRKRLRRAQPGASLGGPIKRNRLFFYTAFEQEHFSAEDQSEINRLTREPINAALSSGFIPNLPIRTLTASRFRTGGDETEAAGKLTYPVSNRHTLNLRLAFTNARNRGDAFSTDALSDRSSRGSAYTRDYQLTGSILSVVSSRLINDLRFQTSTRRFVSRANDSTGPMIEVVGLARFGRPFEGDGTRLERREQLVETITLARSSHELKAGASVNHVSLDDEDRDHFGGLYIFRTLDDLLLSHAALWRQAFGQTATQFGVTSFGAFAQDHWQAASNVTLDLGLRYDVERLPNPFRTDANNLSPRLGLAWNVASGWVVRAGFGLFYDRLPLAFLNRAIQRNGAGAFEQVAFDERAAQVFNSTGGGRVTNPLPDIRPSIYSADPNFKTPYSAQIHFGLERQLSQDLTVRAEYLFTRGVNLPRTRNINLLPPVILTTANALALGFTSTTPQQLGRTVFGLARIDPRYDAIYQLEDSANSTYHGLTFALNKRLSDEWELLASYTLSRAIDDASDFDEQPANPYDLGAERAASRQDARQRFVLSALFDLPFGEDEEDTRAAKRGGSDMLYELLSHIEVAPILTVTSGRPVNALTGADEEHSLAYPLASRPLLFARNQLRTARVVNLDLRAVKYIPFGQLSRLDFVVEAFNLFNHPNVSLINPFFGSAASPLQTFNQPTLFAPPRQLRFSIDFEF